jgi:hypothetical protein
LCNAPNLLGPLRSVKGKAGNFAWLVGLLLALDACAPQPVFRPENPAGLGPVVQDVPGLRISVDTQAWAGQPRSLSNYVLPLLVILQNTGDRPVAIARQDFALLDQANRQSFPLFPVDVLTMVGAGGSGAGIYPSIGVGGYSGGRTAFGMGLGAAFGSWGSDPRDIIPLALAEGPVQPGAELRGFLYFPLPAPDAHALSLVAILRDFPDSRRLEFPFLRAQ